jgi:ectoine hydroxylase-related dioxygenase (phytanoyl-CoA dioxygenase family)
MLSDAQLTFFETEGYLVVEDVLDQKTVLDPVRAEYAGLMDRLYAGWQAEGRVPAAAAGATFWDKLLVAYRAGCDWFQPMDISLPGGAITADCPFHFGPAVLGMITAPRLLDVVEQLIGPEITSNPIQHVRIKPPRHDLRADETRAHITATDWHQDRGVTHDSADATRMVTVWIAVTDATRANGCLQVQPGRHRGELLPHCEKTQVGIPNPYIGGHRSVPLPVGSGGVVIFHPMTPHASLVNKTEGFRWSFDIRFNVTGQPTGRDHFPSFVARSRARPETEFRDAGEWLEMWRAARAALAPKPRVPLYRWDANAPACA